MNKIYYHELPAEARKALREVMWLFADGVCGSFNWWMDKLKATHNLTPEIELKMMAFALSGKGKHND